jgi:uncharacterized protein DUF5317
MRITLLAIAAGFVLALVLGGRPRFLAGRTLRMWFLLPVGLALQIAAIEQHGQTWPFVLLLVSYACLFAFAVANLSVTGMWMIAVGLTLNAFVVGLNHGMPVGHKALAHAGRDPGVYAAEHHVQRSSDKLLILGDVVPISPLGEIVSFGDLILAVGLVDVLVHLMRPTRRRQEEMAEPEPTLPLLDSVVHS